MITAPLSATSGAADQIRSYYISSSHTRLIRWLTLTGWVHLLQTRIDKFGNTNFISLPHECLHRFWALKEMGPTVP